MASLRLQCSLFFILLLSSLSSAHIYLTYPGWRGNNLITNGSVEQTDGLIVKDSWHPYGMQWEYPCGGLPTSTNRTLWPVGGGAVAFQPGWFSGHLLSTLYINLGVGTMPPNMSLTMISNIGINGPSNEPYPGLEICFPQVPLPAGYTPSIGDNATIQVIMLAQHGAALYSCVDITFADPANVEQVTPQNCRNDSQQITFQTVYQTSNLVGAAPSLSAGALIWAAPLAVAFATAILL